MTTPHVIVELCGPGQTHKFGEIGKAFMGKVGLETG